MLNPPLVKSLSGYFSARYCLHVLDEVRVVEDGPVAVARLVDRRPVRVGLVGLGAGDVAELDHLIEHVLLPAMRVFRIERRVEVGRLLRNAGQQRGLGQVQLRGRLVEVGLGGRLDAVRAVPVENLIEIHGQDVVLGELPLQGDGRQRLAPFALDRDLGANRLGMDGAHELLGDGRAAGRSRAAGDDERAAGDGERLDTFVAPEGRVLGGDRGVDEIGRDLFERHECPPAVVLIGDLLQEHAVAIENAGRLEESGRDVGGVGQAAVDLLILLHGRGDRGSGRERAGNDRDGEEKENATASPASMPIILPAVARRRVTPGNRWGGSVLRRPPADRRARSTLVRLTER